MPTGASGPSWADTRVAPILVGISTKAPEQLATALSTLAKVEFSALTVTSPPLHVTCGVSGGISFADTGNGSFGACCCDVARADPEALCPKPNPVASTNNR